MSALSEERPERSIVLPEQERSTRALSERNTTAAALEEMREAEALLAAEMEARASAPDRQAAYRAEVERLEAALIAEQQQAEANAAQAGADFEARRDELLAVIPTFIEARQAYIRARIGFRQARSSARALDVAFPRVEELPELAQRDSDLKHLLQELLVAQNNPL